LAAEAQSAEWQNHLIGSIPFFFVAVREIYFHDMEAGIWGADAVL
jgi:hypothetical protein